MPALVFFLAVCGDNEGSSSTSSTTSDLGHCSAGWEGGPGVDPDYPACGCAPDRCGEAAACGYEGPLPDFTASVCLPRCTALLKCPPLGTLQPSCEDGFCQPWCGVDMMCPDGYVCGADKKCKVQLE